MAPLSLIPRGRLSSQNQTPIIHRISSPILNLILFLASLVQLIARPLSRTSVHARTLIHDLRRPIGLRDPLSLQLS